MRLIVFYSEYFGDASWFRKTRTPVLSRFPVISCDGICFIDDRLCIDNIISELQNKIVPTDGIEYAFEEYDVSGDILSDDDGRSTRKICIEENLELFDELVI